MHLTSPSSTPSTTPEMSLWRPDDTTRATAALPGAADGVWRSDILDAIEETIAGMDEELRAFMGGEAGVSARTTVSSAEEAGCVEGLLKLSQGQWR